MNDREIACLKGHQESKQRLTESPRWTDDDVDQLVEAAYSYEDFARCVLGELRYDHE
mgnify:CR=1 FL=1